MGEGTGTVLVLPEEGEASGTVLDLPEMGVNFRTVLSFPGNWDGPSLNLWGTLERSRLQQFSHGEGFQQENPTLF